MGVWFLARIDWVVERAQAVARAFSRLLWRMAFLYTVVTVVAVMLLLGAAIFYANFWNYDTAAVGSTLTLALMDSSANLVPALENEPPRQQEVQQWVDDAFLGSTLTLAQKDTDPKEAISFSSLVGKGTLVAVVGRDGSIVASNLPDDFSPGSKLADSVSLPGGELIERALQGEFRPVSLFAREEGGLLAAAPVRGEGTTEILGAVYVRMVRISQFEMLLYLIPTVFGSVLFIAIAAAVIGMIFGFITAKSIEKRLNGLSKAVEAWGRGDFSPRIKDRHGDEIGELAQEMNKMAAQLEALVQTRQELAALEERNRLARDLHDSVKQQVFATTMNLGAVQALWEQAPEQARERLDVAAVLSRQSQQELTQLIRTLRPAKLQEKGLAELLREHLSIWEHNSGITVQVDLPATMPALSLNVQELLYRICQEAFANIARHSKATAARLSFEVQNDSLLLHISDNGRGFNVNDPNCSGVGLRSMQERVQKLAGTFQIESSNTGTMVRIEAPVRKDDSHAANRPKH